MHLRFVLILFTLFTITVAGWAQLSKQEEKSPVNLTFNSQGMLTGFPGSIVTKQQTICFTIKIPIRYLQLQLNQFQSRLQTMVDTVNFHKREYRCYFDDSTVFNFSKFLDSATILNSQLKSFWSCQDTSFIMGNTHAMEQIPGKEFLSNMLEKQFEIQVITQDGVAKTISLKAVSFSCIDSCVYFKSAACEKISDLLCASCGVETADSIRFRLLQTDPFTKTLNDWFDQRRKAVSKFDLNAIGGALRSIAVSSAFSTSDATSIKDLKENVFPYWLWYTGGKLTLDPFTTMHPDRVKAISKLVESYDVQIEREKKLKVFSDSISVRVSPSIDNIALYKRVQDSSAKYIRSIDSLTNLKKTAQNLLDNKNSNYPATQTLFYLNNVKLILSDRKTTRIQKQFDAGRKYGEIASSKKKLDRITEVPEDELVYILLYNVDSSSKIEINQSRTNFDDMEHFTKLVKEQLGNVNISAIAVPGVDKFQSFIASLIQMPTLHGLQSDSTGVCYTPKFSNPIYKDITALAKKFASGDSVIFYAKSFFNDKAPEIPHYRTEDRQLGAGYATPYTDTVSVEQSIAGVKSKELVTFINTGKLRFVKLAAGIAFTSHPATTSTIDTSGNGFKMTSSDNQAVAIFGSKVHPWQSYNRDKWLIPRYPLRRLSIFGGFDLLHPLDNFFLGGGYDIVPGLSFSIGANFYLQENYKIENNVVTDTYRSYKLSGLYYGLTVNPELFVQFVKLFFQ